MKMTLEYWPDADGFVGRVREIPGVMSQGDTLEELEANVQDAYELVVSDSPVPPGVVVATRVIELRPPA